jgi:MFS family permease
MPAGALVDRFVPFAVSFAATCLFFIDVCALIFSCGCHSLWAGADAMCNVHVAGPPDCPFCARGVVGYGIVMAAVSAPQAIVSMWAPWRRRTRLLLCVALFPAAMAIVGAIAGISDGYWH